MKRLLLILLVACAGFAVRAASRCRRHLRRPGERDDLGRLRRRLGAVLADLRPAGRDRGRGQLHLPAAAPGARREDGLLRPQLPPPRRDAARALRPGRRHQPRQPPLLDRRDVERLHAAGDRRERDERRQPRHAVDGEQRPVPAKRPDLHADALGPRRAAGAARAERPVHGRRGGRLVAAGLAVRRGRARDLLRRARHRQAGADRGQPVAAQPVPQARRRVHLRRLAGEQGRADARLPDDAGLRRPRARAAQVVARGDEAAGARRQAGRERGRAALDLVVGLGRLERRRARSGQAGRGLRLPLGPRPEPLQRPGRGGNGLQHVADPGPADAPGRHPLHALRQADHREHDLLAGTRHRATRTSPSAPPSPAR